MSRFCIILNVNVESFGILNLFKYPLSNHVPQLWSTQEINILTFHKCQYPLRMMRNLSICFSVFLT